MLIFQVLSVYFSDRGVTVEAFNVETGEIVKKFRPNRQTKETYAPNGYPSVGVRGSALALGLI